MDWAPTLAAAKRMIEKYGVSMQVVISAQDEYDAKSDSMDQYDPDDSTYNVKAVIAEYKVEHEKGQFSKTDAVKLLIPSQDINGVSLPSLIGADFKIVYGEYIWRPDTITILQPGGSVVLYSIEMK